MKKSICIEMLATEFEFYDRFAQVKNKGIDAIEFWGWEDKDLDRIKNLCKENDLQISSFSGDADFSLCDSSQAEQYIEYIKKSMQAAKSIGCETLVIHSNALGENGIVLNHYDNIPDDVKYANMLKTLMALAPIAQENKITLVLEALNTIVDHKGNALWHTDKAAELIRLVDSPYIKVLYDVYHMQIMHGNIIDTIEKNHDTFGLIHIADVPGRHEPGTGEINYKAVCKKLDEVGYKGFVAFELSAKNNFDEAMKAIVEL